MTVHQPTPRELFLTFARLLMTAAANAALYSPGHRQVLRIGKHAMAVLDRLLNHYPDITIKIIENQIIFANKPLPATPATEKLRTALVRHDISFVSIAPGIYSEELLTLVSLLSKTPDKQVDVTDSEHIRYGSVEVRTRKQSGTGHPPLELADLETLEADRHMDLYQRARTRKQLEISGILEIVDGFIDAFSTHGETFLAMAPLRSVDEYTYTHSTNICLLNLAQAKALGIEGQLLNDIGVAAMLHDVGKMFIPPEILSKTDKLDEEEWRIMQQHPRLGAEYLIDTPGIPYLAVVTAFEHHMRYDGQGYPVTATPWKQHLCSQMTAISDTYDAMRTHRAYEEALDLDQIVAIMLNLAGNKLHPELTYSFLNILTQLDKNDIHNG